MSKTQRTPLASAELQIEELEQRLFRMRTERDEARSERDTELAFRQKANARAEAARADARRLREAAEGWWRPRR